jgi:hypothetical protein
MNDRFNLFYGGYRKNGSKDETIDKVIGKITEELTNPTETQTLEKEEDNEEDLVENDIQHVESVENGEYDEEQIDRIRDELANIGDNTATL